MPPFNFAAQSYRSRSAPLDSQRAVNVFVEVSPKDAKTQVPIFLCPGLEIFARAGSGGVIGLHIMADVLYAVSGNQLFSVNDFGLATLLGSTSLGGIVSMADNERQLVMVDGQVGWVYQIGGLNQVTSSNAASGDTTILVKSIGTLTSGDTIKISMDDGSTFTTTISGTPTGVPSNLAVGLSAGLPAPLTAGAVCVDPANVIGRITAPAFKRANTATYFDGYFCFDAAGTNQWFISGLGDGTQYDALDFASAQADPDFVLALVNYHEQLLIMGERTIEVWYDAGAANFPFQRFDGAFVQRGLAAPLAWVKEDNTVFWLGEDGIFYRLDGYRPVRISTFGTETVWAKYRTIANASAYVLTVEGHKFIFLNFPGGPATWCYDISTGAETPLWHERESWGERWIA